MGIDMAGPKNNITLTTINGTQVDFGTQNSFHNKVYFLMFSIIIFTVGKMCSKGKFNFYSKSKLKNTILKSVKFGKRNAFYSSFQKSSCFH